MGEIISSDEEIISQTALDKYPEGVEVTDWLSYDISEHRPVRIYIQDPYDEQNPYLTIPPSYYAGVLRLYTKQLIFVPFKRTGEFGSEDSTDQYNLKHYLIAPGVIYADVVYAYSENLRQQYINALTVFSGEEYRPLWENRIRVAEFGTLDSEPDMGSESESDFVPDSVSKRKLLFCIGLNELIEHGESVIGAVKDRLSVMAENASKLSVKVAFYPSDFGMWQNAAPVAGPVTESIAESEPFFRRNLQTGFSEKLWDAVVDTVFENGFEMVQINPDSADEMALEYDAYYGSPSPMVPAFTMIKKPVMLADYSLRL